MANVDEIRADFIEKVGMMSQSDGLPRISGRVLGLLIFDGTAVSFGDLAEQLQVSRGSISSASRMLVDRGMIKRVSRPGQRQDFFQLADKPYATMLRNVALGLEKAKAEIDNTVQELDAERSDAKARVSAYAAFYGVMIDAVGSSIEAVEAKSP